MPVDPRTGDRLPYPGEPGFEDVQAGAPPAMGGMEPMGPETLDGPEMGVPQLGMTLEPAQMAAMAMQAIAQMAEMEQAALDQLLMQAKMRFTAEQQAALAQVPDAIAAIMAQMQGPPPETLDGPVSTLPIEEEPPPAGIAPEEMGAPV
jgi:hypothetical protein